MSSRIGRTASTDWPAGSEFPRLDSRPLDLRRPLWEMYVIEGLDNVPGVAAGSHAIFTKLHHAAVDGHSMRDIVSGIHDLTPDLEDSRYLVSRHDRCEHQSGLRRALSRQNSLPSGSTRTCHCSCPVWPMSAGRAPSFRRRSSSAS